MIVALIGGCASKPPTLSLAHQVDVPPSWRSGRDTPGSWGESDIERYVDAFERGWWSCIELYARNIDFDSKEISFGSGWPSECEGWQAGVWDAAARIRQLVGTFGRERISEYLIQFRDNPWFERWTHAATEP